MTDDVPEITTAQFKACWIEHPVTMGAYMWLQVHGALTLALRHPDCAGAERANLKAFVKALGDALIEWGVLTAELTTMVTRFGATSLAVSLTSFLL